jgi:hypothetical protein
MKSFRYGNDVNPINQFQAVDKISNNKVKVNLTDLNLNTGLKVFSIPRSRYIVE